jgi:ABC-2 type transport system ATP-binding protein
VNILEIHDVSKNFGTKKVLQHLDLAVPKGAIFGFVGENGAGKTTTMKLILGLAEVESGEIFVKGEKVHFGNTPTNRITGYLPDVPQFYDYLTAKEYLQLCGEITGLKKAQLSAKISEMLTLVGLAQEKKKIRGYSRGMKQRLGIAQALLNDPELLICDEPTSALDPSGRNEFLELLASLRGKTTILFSTHILSDVERICDYVGILDGGRLVVSDTLVALKERFAQPKIELRFAKNQKTTSLEAPFDTLRTQKIITEARFEPETTSWQLSYRENYAEVMEQLFLILGQMHCVPQAIYKIDPSLEQIFLEVTK